MRWHYSISVKPITRPQSKVSCACRIVKSLYVTTTCSWVVLRSAEFLHHHLGCEAPAKCSVSVAEATIVPSFVFHRTLQLQAAHLFCNSFIRSQSAKLVGIFVEVISVVSVAGHESSFLGCSEVSGSSGLPTCVAACLRKQQPQGDHCCWQTLRSHL